MTDYKDWYEALLIRLNPPRPPIGPHVEPAVRPLPRFFQLPEFKRGERFVATIPTAVRTWWIVGLLAIAAIWFFGIPLAGWWAWIPWKIEWVQGRNIETGGYLSKFRILIALSVFAALSHLIWRLIFPRIIISADQTGIKIDRFTYSWEDAAGFRMGYAAGGVERDEKQLWYHGLRFANGPYGDDLPYMVSNYYIPVYVVLLNQLLELVHVDGSGVANQNEGIKQEMY